MTDIENWIDKHTPVKISELISNEPSVLKIVSWLKKFEKNKQIHLKLISMSKNKKKKPKKG